MTHLFVDSSLEKASMLIERLHGQVGALFMEAYMTSNVTLFTKRRTIAEEADMEFLIMLRRILNFESVVNAVSVVHGVPRADIVSTSRLARFSLARHHVAWYLRENGSRVWSYPVIARNLGERDHTTILHSATEGHKRLTPTQRDGVDRLVWDHYREGRFIVNVARQAPSSRVGENFPRLERA